MDARDPPFPTSKHISIEAEFHPLIITLLATVSIIELFNLNNITLRLN